MDGIVNVGSAAVSPPSPQVGLEIEIDETVRVGAEVGVTLVNHKSEVRKVIESEGGMTVFS